MANQVQIELEILAKAALESVEKFRKSAQSSLDTINFNTTVTAINSGLELIGKVAGPVFDLLQTGFSKATEEALQAEESQFKLANALRLTGDSAGGALAEFESLAKEIQRTTTFTDDAVLAGAGLAKQYQLTNAEAKKVLVVAADLAAATGTDLDTAIRTLSQSFNGVVDKGLAKVIPGLKTLSVEALVSGAALDKIRDRVQGTAAALADTFGGSLQQTKNALSDVFEELGKVIIQNPKIVASVQAIKKALEQLSETIAANGAGIGASIADSFISLVKAGPAIVQSLRAVDTVFSTIGVSVLALGRTIGAIVAGIQSFRDGAKGAGQAIVEALKADVADDFANNTARINGLYDNLGKAAQVAADAIGNAAANTTGFKNEVNAVGKSVSGVASRTDALFDADNIRSATLQVAKLKDGFADLVKSKATDLGKQTVQGLVEFSIKGQDEIDKISRSIDEQVQAITSSKTIQESFKKQAIEIGNQAKQTLQSAISRSLAIAVANNVSSALARGAEGAKKLVAQAFGAAAEVAFPGFGAAATEIVGILQQGPDAVRNTVKEFVKAIPETIKSIAASLPVLIETLAQELPAALAKTMPLVATQFSIELVKNIPNIVQGFAKGLVDAAKQFVETVIDAIKGTIGLDGGSGNGGLPGSDGFLKGDVTAGRVAAGIFTGGLNEIFGNPFGFAEGGRIPDLPKFEGDRARTNLSAGEQVFSKDLSNRLEQFLTGASGGGQPQVINIQIGQQQFAQAILNTRRAGFRT